MFIRPLKPWIAKSYPGRFVQGPECPNPEIEPIINRGLIAHKASRERPSFLEVFGKKIFEQDIAFFDKTTEDREAFGPGQIEGDGLLVAIAGKKIGTQFSTNGGPQVRVSSPMPGLSSLITSARSPRIWPQNGPAKTREASSIRKP